MPFLRVLVVESHPEIARLVQLVLGRAGCETIAVETGSEAIALISRERFDVIVLDALVPLEERFLFEHLAELYPDALPRTVIVTTLRDNQPVMQRLQALGPCVILLKPFDIHELLEAVSKRCASPLPDPEPCGRIDRRRLERAGM